MSVGDSDDDRIAEGVLHVALVERETVAKLPFYAEHGVDEVVIIDPPNRSVTWLRRDGAGYVDVDQSSVVRLGTRELTQAIEWPPAAD